MCFEVILRKLRLFTMIQSFIDGLPKAKLRQLAARTCRLTALWLFFTNQAILPSSQNDHFHHLQHHQYVQPLILRCQQTLLKPAASCSLWVHELELSRCEDHGGNLKDHFQNVAHLQKSLSEVPHTFGSPLLELYPKLRVNLHYVGVSQVQCKDVQSHHKTSLILTSNIYLVVSDAFGVPDRDLNDVERKEHDVVKEWHNEISNVVHHTHVWDACFRRHKLVSDAALARVLFVLVLARIRPLGLKIFGWHSTLLSSSQELQIPD